MKGKASLFYLHPLWLTLLCSCTLSGPAPWWEEPPQREGKVVAVGMAEFRGNISASRAAAEAVAMKSLARFVESQITSLTETWAKQAGDKKITSAITNYFNDETAVRELINTSVRGAKTLKWKDNHNGYTYVLMEIDAKAYANYWKEAASKRILDPTLLISQALKDSYLDRMDKYVDQYLKRIGKGAVAK